jgi:hypothetical protein
VVGQALKEAQLLDWQCGVEHCEEDAVLFAYTFPNRETIMTEGVALCHEHLRSALMDAVLAMTDDEPTLHHIILGRP